VESGVEGEDAVADALGVVGDTVRGAGVDGVDIERGVNAVGAGVHASGETGSRTGPSTCWRCSSYSSATVKGCMSMVSVAPPQSQRAP
jgi:6-phosphogluconate dehydrogenase